MENYESTAENHVSGGDSDNHGLPRANGAIARLAYRRAKAAKVDLEPLLKGAHLTSAQMENPGCHVKVRDQIHFLNLVAEALHDDYLGFHLAQVPDLREFGLLYYVVASADTLADAFKRVARYSSIFNEGVALNYLDTQDMVLSSRYVGVHRHPDRHQMEFVLTGLLRVGRQLSGVRIVPKLVTVAHFRPDHNAELRKYFGSHIQFGAIADEMIFEKKIGQMPIVTADPYLHKLLVTYCEEALSQKPLRNDLFQSNVVNAIVPLLPHGKAHAGEIARRLGMGTRTFARRLSSEGLTFSGLLERLRLDLANRYLLDKNLSISQIAWLLGYQEVSGFSHAFKRWSGQTPRAARNGAE
jgi:AraC-like DNA-binding protein